MPQARIADADEDESKAIKLPEKQDDLLKKLIEIASQEEAIAQFAKKLTEAQWEDVKEAVLSKIKAQDSQVKEYIDILHAIGKYMPENVINQVVEVLGGLLAVESFDTRVQLCHALLNFVSNDISIKTGLRIKDLILKRIEDANDNLPKVMRIFASFVNKEFLKNLAQSAEKINIIIETALFFIKKDSLSAVGNLMLRTLLGISAQLSEAQKLRIINDIKEVNNEKFNTLLNLWRKEVKPIQQIPAVQPQPVSDQHADVSRAKTIEEELTSQADRSLPQAAQANTPSEIKQPEVVEVKVPQASFTRSDLKQILKSYHSTSLLGKACNYFSFLNKFKHRSKEMRALNKLANAGDLKAAITKEDIRKALEATDKPKYIACFFGSPRRLLLFNGNASVKKNKTSTDNIISSIKSRCIS